MLDIAIKVYVYYCAQPPPEIAQRIVAFLNGAVDTPILKCLKKSKCAGGTILAATIQEVDQRTYQALRSLVLAKSRACHIHPVQYDDVMWRQLNREKPGPNEPLQQTAAGVTAFRGAQIAQPARL